MQISTQNVINLKKFLVGRCGVMGPELFDQIVGDNMFITELVDPHFKGVRVFKVTASPLKLKVSVKVRSTTDVLRGVESAVLLIDCAPAINEYCLQVITDRIEIELRALCLRGCGGIVSGSEVGTLFALTPGCP